jgi:hypothetical protein
MRRLPLQLPIFNQGGPRIARSEPALRRAYDKFEQEANEWLMLTNQSKVIRASVF